MTERDEGALYIVGVFETHVVMGRVSELNLKRSGELMENLPGMEEEKLEGWQSGTREEMLLTFPHLLGDWAFEDADKAYQLDSRRQITFERPDL